MPPIRLWAWGAVNSWAANIPYAWPHDGLQNEKGRDDATLQKNHYQNAGFRMLPAMASWPEIYDGSGNVKSGGNSVEQGLFEIAELMRTGRFKISRGLIDLLDEWRQYHRDEKGKIVKKRDDLLDAMRYAYMMRRYAVRIGSIGVTEKVFIPAPIKPMGR